MSGNFSAPPTLTVVSYPRSSLHQGRGRSQSLHGPDARTKIEKRLLDLDGDEIAIRNELQQTGRDIQDGYEESLNAEEDTDSVVEQFENGFGGNCSPPLLASLGLNRVYLT